MKMTCTLEHHICLLSQVSTWADTIRKRVSSAQGPLSSFGAPMQQGLVRHVYKKVL